MDRHDRPPDPSGWRETPRALRTAAVVGGCLLVLTAAVALAGWMLVRLAPLTLAVIAALLLTALLGPVSDLARRAGAPPWLSALAGVLFLILVVAGPLTLVTNQAIAQFDDLRRQAVAGLESLRRYLTAGPLSRQQLDAAVAELAGLLQRAAPDPVAGAMTAVQTVGAVVIALILLFFLLRDGAGMWGWLLARFPARSRGRVDAAARAGWQTLVSYVRGTVLVAAIDGVGVGIALLVLGVPLALALAFLTFLLAFIPLVGAFVAGALAVLVALVSNGVPTALLVLAAVILVQQLEGNLLQPLIIGRALNLHPAVVIVVVTAGGLVGGIAGAVVAVPLVVVAYRIFETARTYPGDAAGTGDSGAGPPATGRAAPAAGRRPPER